jgi:cytochrome c oxidase cbb3-type subunit 3
VKVSTIALACLAAAVTAAGVTVRAQAPATPVPAPAQAPATPGRGQQAGPPEAYPQRPPVDPAILERGKALYGVHCAFCHGADARGGDGGGPNLLRSQLVLSDQKGELIGEVVTKGRPNTLMVPMQLSPEQISDIAAYVHSFRVGGYDITRRPPASIVVGDARAGETAFRSRCASCHSITGDLRNIGSKIPEPRDLQQMWLMPSAAGRGAPPVYAIPPITATVTLASGEKVQGRLIRIDDFVITIEPPNAMARSFGRRGDQPKVEIHDPLKPHRELLSKYTDKEIHDITAYLVTVK